MRGSKDCISQMQRLCFVMINMNQIRSQKYSGKSNAYNLAVKVTVSRFLNQLNDRGSEDYTNQWYCSADSLNLN